MHAHVGREDEDLAITQLLARDGLAVDAHEPQNALRRTPQARPGSSSTLRDVPRRACGGVRPAIRLLISTSFYRQDRTVSEPLESPTALHDAESPRKMQDVLRPRVMHRRLCSPEPSDLRLLLLPINRAMHSALIKAWPQVHTSIP
jgi:hypothetical protein